MSEVRYAIRQLRKSPGFALVGLHEPDAEPDAREFLVVAVPRRAGAAQVFSDLALSIGNPFTLTGQGDPEQLIGLMTSAALTRRKAGASQ